ncbi:hypothetical protein M5K25_018336 [Dendrobium thyrsiflorum]|uniref:Uncharacterized protein n=1 Tax=Dendrobium thyrsiflorum TaxID=117978 RepID=A0ABD0UHQ3_DENTH
MPRNLPTSFSVVCSLLPQTSAYSLSSPCLANRKATIKNSAIMPQVLEEHSKMWPRWTLQRPLEEAKIIDIRQEISRLKKRLSRLERRKYLSPLVLDFDGIRPQGTYAPMMTLRSSVPTKSLRIDDDDKDISDDQISSTYEDVFEGPPRQSSTPPSIESSFEGFEDPLPKLTSLSATMSLSFGVTP